MCSIYASLFWIERSGDIRRLGFCVTIIGYHVHFQQYCQYLLVILVSSLIMVLY